MDLSVQDQAIFQSAPIRFAPLWCKAAWLACRGQALECRRLGRPTEATGGADMRQLLCVP